mgnify:CR=1 FL=1
MIVTAGRHRLAHPLHLPAADRRRADVGRDHDDGRRHRARHRHVRDDLHAGTVAHPSDARGGRSVSDEPGLHRARATAATPGALRRADRGRAPCGLKLHEDWGTTPAAIDNCLRGRRRNTTCRSRSTPTRINESGFVGNHARRRSAAAPIGTFHTEGAGGGHAPDIIKACGEPNVLPSSTNPTHALHRQHDRRAPRHADGVPSPRSGDRRGRRLRRVAHPPARRSPPRTSCTTWARSR